MNSGSKNTLLREVLSIVILSMVVAFVYNFFSPKGISLVRTEPKKIDVEDSALFPQKTVTVDTSLTNVTRQSEQTKSGPDTKHTQAQSNSKISEANKKESVYKVVTLAQVKRLLAEGRGLFIDARDTEAYRKGHMKGSINIFGDEPDLHFPELAPLPRDTLIVLYCNGPDCHLGRALAEFMSVMEFTNLFLYDDGWEGWQKAKMPEEQSSSK